MTLALPYGLSRNCCAAYRQRLSARHIKQCKPSYLNSRWCCRIPCIITEQYDPALCLLAFQEASPEPHLSAQKDVACRSQGQDHAVTVRLDIPAQNDMCIGALESEAADPSAGVLFLMG